MTAFFPSLDPDAFLGPFSSLFESSISINSSELGDFLGHGVFVAAFFSLFDPDAFLGSSSSILLETSVSIYSGDFDTFLGHRLFVAAFFSLSDPDTFLGCGVFLALFLLWRLIISISSI